VQKLVRAAFGNNNVDTCARVCHSPTGYGLKHTLGDIDGAIGPAQERLERTLDELRGAGIEADGEVGDSDPMVAISDEILKFHPDQILLVGHRDKEGAYAERGLLEQIGRAHV
jgi:hypothetical protein